MIYKREEYVQQAEEGAKFPVRQIEAMTDIDTGESTFVGQVALGLQTPMGVQQIPVSFEIPAPTIKEAFDKFEETAAPRVEEARKGIEEEINRMRREQAGRIIRPEEIGGLGAAGLGAQPGAGGGIISPFKKS